MNLFRLSNDPREAARLNQDLHIKKIIIEVSQLLANVYDLDKLKEAPKTQKGEFRKHSYFNHPLSIWIRKDYFNFDWALTHARELCSEYLFRFNKKHFCEQFIDWVYSNQPEPLPFNSPIEQPQCFGDWRDKCFVPNDPVEGYKRYYNACKLIFDFRGKPKIATWTKRQIPEFINFKNLTI